MSIVTPSNTKKIYIATTSNEDELKEQKSLYSSLYNANKIEDLPTGYNTYLFKIKNKFLVVDVDSVKGLNYVNELLTKHNINADELKMTRSISNVNKINKSKYHIYFKNNLNIEKNKLMDGLDLLTKGLLFEDSKQFNKKINIDELPEINKDFYNDLLLYKQSAPETNINNVDFIDDEPTINNTVDEEYEKFKRSQANKLLRKKLKAEQNENLTNELINNTSSTKNKDVYKILEFLNVERFNNYNDWLYLNMIFINEKLDINILNSYCKKSSKYNEVNNNKILKSIKPNNGLTSKTLYYWLKYDNITEFNKLVQYNNKFFDASLINNKDIAELYYNMNPNQFIYNKNLGWYAYNEYNILLEYEQNAPTLLLNDVASKIHEWLNTLKNSINLADENKSEKFKMIAKAYTKIGMSSFIKGCIDFLKNLYNVEKLDEKIDANKNVLAFENLLYDLEIGNFRKIRHNDYIILNTKYSINIKSNPKTRERINKLLYSIFENEGVITFWKISTALSIFGKSFESLNIHTGTGRNGKGVLSTVLKGALGDYFLSTDNTFLTTIFKSGQANSTLAQSKGVRFLLVTEPDNGTADCSLNIDFVKLMTGGDEISARDLYAKASTFKPFFSLLLQCNQKPKLNKIDKAIEERLKIIHYPFTFVDNPTHPEERIKDNNLKDLIIEQDFINEFILMLLEVANENKNIKYIELPEEVKQQNKEYLEENNNILTFINEYYEVTKDEKNKIKSSDLLTNYNAFNDSKIDSKKLKQMMEYNRFKTKRFNDGIYYTNLILKRVEVVLEPSDFD